MLDVINIEIKREKGREKVLIRDSVHCEWSVGEMQRALALERIG